MDKTYLIGFERTLINFEFDILQKLRGLKTLRFMLFLPIKKWIYPEI